MPLGFLWIYSLAAGDVLNATKELQLIKELALLHIVDVSPAEQIDTSSIVKP